MLRKLACAVVLLGLCVGVTFADEVRAIITKIDGDKITFAESKKKGEKGEEQTLTVTADVKVVQGKYNQDTKKLEAGDAISDGLKNEMFTKIGEKGMRAVIVTNDDKKITEIRVGGGKKKKDQ